MTSTSWRRWGSRTLKDFVRPGDFVTPTGNSTKIYKNVNDLTLYVGSLSAIDIALVIATRDVSQPVDNFNARWLLIMCHATLGWCAATSVQSLDLE
jgi:hypothetical protein